MGVGKTGQIIGETGVGETGVGETGVIRLFILHWILLFILVLNGQLTAYLLNFGPKLTFGQVLCGCLIESKKHFGNNSTGCWLGYGGGCLMQRQYIGKLIGNVSDWLS